MPRPLLLLLAYRQEATVGEAVRAALAQEGPALDILVSDDCSPDGTWSIIERHIAEYSGPHTVRAVRNETNLGLIPHLNARMSETDAEHVIIAAGDDVSEPDRVRRTMEAFDETNALLVHSNVTPIDAAGAPASDAPKGKLSSTTSPESAARSLGLYIGATGAWRRELFTKYGPMPDGVHEDLILGFRAVLEGRTAYIDAPLVRYRVDQGLSARPASGLSRDAWIEDRKKVIARGIRTFEQRLLDADTAGLKQNDPVRRVLLSKLVEYKARSDVLGEPLSALILNRTRRSAHHLRAWWSERKREKNR